MPPAPWDGAAAADQLFVLVTGANSGIGLGIGQRLIDAFAAQHPSADAHLVLITTTRSAAKSRATVDALRAHVADEENARARAARRSLHPQRIHLASVELDLCALPSVHAAAARLRGGPITIYPAHGGATATTTAAIPRLDRVVLNAGIGGWTALHWGRMAASVLTGGVVDSTTYPDFKAAETGRRVDPLTGRVLPLDANVDVDDDDDDGTTLGQVFCANVFGHYVLVHALRPLLGAGARVVWESSIEAVCWRYLGADDLQGLRTDAAYESSKRLTDVLALTAELPGVVPYARAFWGGDDDGDGDGDDSAEDRPQHYLTHPGVVCSSIFPLPWFLVVFYHLAMYVARWLGSPWHAVTAYNGAAAAVWVALQPQAVLDGLEARRVKWGTSTTRDGTTLVKRTEVEGWGWRGRVGEEDTAAAAEDPLAALFPGYPDYLRNSRGRRRAAVALTAERRQEFEVLGRDCWREMERLRVLWDGRVAAWEKERKS